MENKSEHIREFYAIITVVAKFRHHLLGKKFIICIDHQSLKALTDQKLHTPKQHKWLHKLLEYNFEIHYKLGRENMVVDALSK